MELLGYILAIMMGLILGLIGAGGSILTVPILVYLLGIQPIIATGYSLLIVGAGALFGALRYYRQGHVDLQAALVFSIPAMMAVLFTRALVIPNLPDPILGIPKDSFIMLLFAFLMLAVARFMWNPLTTKAAPQSQQPTERLIKLVLASAGVGCLTGMVGAGGGFLIIPTLVALFGLPIKLAVGTSLTVIAINSLIGFQGDILSGIPMNAPVLGLFLGLTLLGMWLGTTLGKNIDGMKLRNLFGVFTALVGILILITEVNKLAFTVLT